jgi:predicted O-methyltransferase YrrM
MNIASRALEFIARRAYRALRDERNVDLCLSTVCRPESLAEIRYPVAYIEFLRSCIEHLHCTVKEVKAERDTRIGNKSERFTALLKLLATNVPPLEFSVAGAIALVADRYRTLQQPIEFEGWAGDISLHFDVSSSFGKKGRILSAIVRLMRSERCLEVGTAYGMSALFILEALRSAGRTGHLTTLDGFELAQSLSSSMLKERYGDIILCQLGNTQESLPQLAKTVAPIDFLFHDAGHSREDYTRDFDAVRDSFAEGGAVLVDDIRGNGPGFGGGTGCYEGWKQVCADARVCRAAEVDHTLGMLLLR